MRADDLRPPDTAAVRAARDVAARSLPPSLVAHSERSGRWAVAFGRIRGVPVGDPELLAVAALLHDVGLAEEFDAVRVPYETAGGHVAAVFAAGAGWARERQQRLIEVIERHNWPAVDAAFDPEGHLLEAATALDISGAHAEELPRDLLAAVLAELPRGDLATVFGDRVEEQAARKPASQAARIVAGRVRERLAHHPLDAF